MNWFRAVTSVVLFAGLASLAAGQGALKELEGGKPSSIDFAPPKLLEVKAEEHTLFIRFREIDLARVTGYRLYRKIEDKWKLVNSRVGSPIRIEKCRTGSADYALAALDESGLEGQRRFFTGPLACDVTPGK